MVAAAGLDRLIGDPVWSPHPVVWMGRLIHGLRPPLEHWAGDRPGFLRVGGLVLTMSVVIASGMSAWLLEQILVQSQGVLHGVMAVVVTVALASALAAKSLDQAVLRVINALPSSAMQAPTEARQQLSWIVGRDTTELSANEILRATAETASENAVDGLFAPLFWMLVGTGLWSAGLMNAPGPLTLAWSFKAASTLDSMLGYRKGRLRWLGTAGARLDDLLTWIPCRLVMLTLPLISQPIGRWATLVLAAERDGQHDPSPNAGRSEAIYAHCAEVQLGGRNRYGSRWIDKPLLGEGFPGASPKSVATILNLSWKLEVLWLLMALGCSLWI